MPAIDPKELKTLSDILALVLEEQPGQSESALQALRVRARRSTVTGGALKNLFVAIANDPPARATAAASRPRAPRGKAATDVAAAHVRIAQLANDVRTLDLDLRTARAETATLRAELDQTRRARAEAQARLQQIDAERSETRTRVVMLSAVGGMLLVVLVLLVLRAFGGL